MNTMTLQANDLARLLRGAAVQRLVMPLNVLLVIWIAAQLAELTWLALPQPETGAEPVAVVARPAVPAARDPNEELVSGLPGWHLMGLVVREAAPVVESAPVDAPDTRLKLTLRGALASDDSENARAIIADQGGKEEQYAIGDMLPGNAELSEIYPDRVILRRNGRYETLRLPTEGQAGASVAVSPARTNASATPAERLRAIRENARANPASLFQLVRASQKMDEAGNIIGYSVTPGNQPALFREVGLRSGDVVTEINGLALSDPANSSKALQSLQGGEAVTLRLLRGDEEHTLTLDAQQ